MWKIVFSNTSTVCIQTIWIRLNTCFVFSYTNVVLLCLIIHRSKKLHNIDKSFLYSCLALLFNSYQMLNKPLIKQHTCTKCLQINIDNNCNVLYSHLIWRHYEAGFKNEAGWMHKRFAWDITKKYNLCIYTFLQHCSSNKMWSCRFGSWDIIKVVFECDKGKVKNPLRPETVWHYLLVVRFVLIVFTDIFYIHHAMTL